jgi:hypothetical protein
MMRTSCTQTSALILASAILLSAFAGCHQRSTAANDETPDNSTYRPEQTPGTQFERDLKYVRDGHFTHVWVFTRLDGREFTKDDGDFLRTNAPKVVDWVGTDGKKKFIAGSNFDLDPTQMAALQKRFKVDDYSGK